MAGRMIAIHACALIIIVLVVSGCNRNGTGAGGKSKVNGSGAVGGDDAGAGANKDLTIAIIPKSIGGEFWKTVEEGVRNAGEELGVTIKWEGPHAETELAEQNKIIENMVNLGVDGMSLAPLNNRTMREPVERAVEAGIPVVIFDSAVDGDAHISYVATNNKTGGELAAKFIYEQLGSKKLGKGMNRLFLLRYIQGAASTEQRSQGFLDAANAAGFEVLADPYCDDATVAGAIKTASNVLEGFVEDGKLQLDGMFAVNLISTIGLLEALKDLRKGGVETDAVFIGFDTSPMLVEELQAGNIDGLVSQNPTKMGYLAVETIVKHLRGEKVPKEIDTGVELVTSERLEKEPEIRKLVGLK